MSSRRSRGRKLAGAPSSGSKPSNVQRVPSLLDAMKDGHEYTRIVSSTPPDGVDFLDDVARALAAVEQLRQRPCLIYAGNVVRRDDGDSGIDATDDLPFAEMVARVPAAVRDVDLFLTTRGGSADQVARFVNSLRPRFDNVHFLLPSFCMSAGTLFVLSGNSIWMTDRACLGPIDPQVPSKDGRYVPAQALLFLIKELQRQGDEAMKKGQSVPWTAVRLVDSMDKKELGAAITASGYSTQMATQFLLDHKFRDWKQHKSSGAAVTDPEREAAANLISEGLAAHDRWKHHGHAISREILWKEIHLLIDHPDPQLERGLVRLWALFHWIFDKTAVVKCIMSQQYRFVRSATLPKATP